MSPIKDPDKDPIIVNQILGKEAALGGLIPTSHLLPWIIIIIVAYIVTNAFLSLGMPAFLGISAWLIISWTIVVGKQPHHFINKFKAPLVLTGITGTYFTFPLSQKTAPPLFLIIIHTVNYHP